MQVDVEPDGTVWLGKRDELGSDPTLLRFDGSEWQGWGPADEVPLEGYRVGAAD